MYSTLLCVVVCWYSDASALVVKSFCFILFSISWWSDVFVVIAFCHIFESHIVQMAQLLLSVWSFNSSVSK